MDTSYLRIRPCFTTFGEHSLTISAPTPSSSSSPDHPLHKEPDTERRGVPQSGGLQPGPVHEPIQPRGPQTRRRGMGVRPTGVPRQGVRRVQPMAGYRKHHRRDGRPEGFGRGREADNSQPRVQCWNNQVSIGSFVQGTQSRSSDLLFLF